MSARVEAEPGKLVVYAGREAQGLPVREGEVLLGDRDAWPRQLWPALDSATLLLILDPMSFPYEQLRSDDEDLPIAVALSAPLEADDLVEVLATPLLARLSRFDLVITSDDRVWRTVRDRHRFGESQRLNSDPRDPHGVLEAVRRTLSSHEAAGDLRRAKARHVVEADVLEPRLRALTSPVSHQANPKVLHVGVGDGRWLRHVPPAAAEIVAVGPTSEVETAEENHPDLQIDEWTDDGDLPFADEAFDVVFAVRAVTHRGPKLREQLLAEMWRVTAPGGRLVLVEEFVPQGDARDALSFSGFSDLMLEVSAWRLTLDELRSLRYPGEIARHAALVELSKLGPPARL